MVTRRTPTPLSNEGGARNRETRPAQRRGSTCAAASPIIATVSDKEAAADDAARIRDLEYTIDCLEERQRELLRSEARARLHAYHDELTGLPNRRLFKDRLEQALLQGARQARPLALILLDLDDFKCVNDSLGHPVGDEVLRVAAQRIKAGTRGGDTACRFGGDEFVVMLVEFTDIRAVDVVVAKLQATLRKPYLVRGFTIRMSASVGRVVYPYDGDCLEALIEKADRALYSAKAGSAPTVITDLRSTPVEPRGRKVRALHAATDAPDA